MRCSNAPRVTEGLLGSSRVEDPKRNFTPGKVRVKEKTMHNQLWHVEVLQPSGASKSFFVADRPLELAEMLSKGQPTASVRVDAFARIRAIFEGGKLVKEFDIRKFYTNISDAEAHAWANGFAIPNSPHQCPACKRDGISKKELDEIKESEERLIAAVRCHG